MEKKRKNYFLILLFAIVSIVFHCNNIEVHAVKDISTSSITERFTCYNDDDCDCDLDDEDCEHDWGEWEYADNDGNSYISEKEIPCPGGIKWRTCRLCGEESEIIEIEKKCSYISKANSKGKMSRPKCNRCGSTELEDESIYNSLLLDEYQCYLELSMDDDIDNRYLVTGKINRPAVTPYIVAYEYDEENEKKYVDSYAVPKKYYTVTYSGNGKKAGTYKATVKLKGIYSGTKSISYKMTSSPMRVNKLTIEHGYTYGLKVFTGKEKIKWKSSNKKVATITSDGVLYAEGVGKATITATYKGKKYKTKITVTAATPRFGTILYDYNTRNNYFVVKIKNDTHMPITVLSGTTKVIDKDYKTFDRKINLSKSCTIKPGKMKTLKFKVQGNVTWYDVTGYTLYYNIKLDGKKYSVKTNWNNVSKYKKGSKWKNSYRTKSWFEDFRMEAWN